MKKYTAVLLSTLGIVVPNTRHLDLDDRLTRTRAVMEMLLTALPHPYPRITYQWLQSM